MNIYFYNLSNLYILIIKSYLYTPYIRYISVISALLGNPEVNDSDLEFSEEVLNNIHKKQKK